MSDKYKIREIDKAYFLTLIVTGWGLQTRASVAVVFPKNLTTMPELFRKDFTAEFAEGFAEIATLRICGLDFLIWILLIIFRRIPEEKWRRTGGNPKSFRTPSEHLPKSIRTLSEQRPNNVRRTSEEHPNTLRTPSEGGGTNFRRKWGEWRKFLCPYVVHCFLGFLKIDFNQ